MGSSIVRNRRCINIRRSTVEECNTTASPITRQDTLVLLIRMSTKPPSRRSKRNRMCKRSSQRTCTSNYSLKLFTWTNMAGRSCLCKCKGEGLSMPLERLYNILHIRTRARGQGMEYTLNSTTLRSNSCMNAVRVREVMRFTGMKLRLLLAIRAIMWVIVGTVVKQGTKDRTVVAV